MAGAPDYVTVYDLNQLKAGLFTASAQARALFEDGFFDNATLQRLVPDAALPKTKLPTLFTEAFSGPTSQAGAGAWQDWDLSAIVAADAKMVLVGAWVRNARDVGARKNGSAVERRNTTGNTTLGAPGGSFQCWWVELDAGKVIERYTSGAVADASWYVLGWV